MTAGSVRRAALALGSNLGDRTGNLRSALATVAADPRTTVVAVSPVYETEPVGGPQQPSYLNAVVTVDTALSPYELLDLAHRAEAAAGRTRDVRWGPRTLDVDVLAVGELVLDDPSLTVPHPWAARRRFVLVPWADVDPDFEVPGAGPVRELLAALVADTGADREGVRVTAVHLEAPA